MVSVLDHCMCKGVQSSDPYNPIGRTNEFQAKIEEIYQWTRFGKMYSGGLVEWKWYKDGYLYYDGPSYRIEDPSEYGYEWWDWYAVWVWWDWLYAGSYSAEVYFEGSKVVTENFTVKVPTENIKETIYWEATIPFGSHKFYLFSLFGTNTNNTIEGFQIEKGVHKEITTESMSRADDLITYAISKFDCLTIIAEKFDGSTISEIYDWEIKNNV